VDEKDIIEMLERLAEEYPDGFSVDVLGVINNLKKDIEVKHGRNITEVHPVDEFICSECGFICCDFSEMRIDEETGDVSYREFEMGYCPRCGAKMDK